MEKSFRSKSFIYCLSSSQQKAKKTRLYSSASFTDAKLVQNSPTTETISRADSCKNATKSRADYSITATKPVTGSSITATKSIADNSITATKSIADSSITATKSIADSSITAKKSLFEDSITELKRVASNKNETLNDVSDDSITTLKMRESNSMTMNEKSNGQASPVLGLNIQPDAKEDGKFAENSTAMQNMNRNSTTVKVYPQKPKVDTEDDPYWAKSVSSLLSHMIVFYSFIIYM